MGKKKVEVLFKLNLLFDDKCKVEKSSLRSYLEEKIKGLHILTYDSFNTVKDTIKAEILSNFISLLPSGDLLKEQGKIVQPEECEELKEGTVADKLVEQIRILLATYNEKSKRKTVADNLDKFLDAIENKAMEVRHVLAMFKKENTQLKETYEEVKKIQSASVTLMSKNFSEANMDQTASILKNLESENKKLISKISEYEEKLKLYDKNIGDKVLLDRISELEKQLKTVQSLHDSDMKEQQEKSKLLSLQIIEQSDKIKELEDQLKLENKEDLLNAKKSLEIANEKLIEFDNFKKSFEQENSELRARIISKDEQISNLTNDLAKSLSSSMNLKDRIKLLENQLDESLKKSSTPSSLPLIIGSGENIEKPVKIIETETKIERKKLENDSQSTSHTINPIISEDYEKCMKRLGDVENELKIKNNKLSNLTALLSQKEEEIVKAIDNYKQLKNELSKNNIQLESETNKKNILQDKVASLDSNIFELNMQNTTHKERLEKAQELIARKEEEKIRLLKMVDERNQIIRENEERYIEYEKNKEELEKMIVNLQAKTQTKTNILTSETNVTSTKLEELKKKIENLELDLKFKNEKIKRLENMRETSTVKSENKENEELRKKINELQNNCENMKKLIEITNSDSSKLFEEIEGKDLLIEKLQKQLSNIDYEINLRVSESKIKIESDLELCKKEKFTALTSLEKCQEESKNNVQKIKEMNNLLDEKAIIVKQMEGNLSKSQQNFEEFKNKQEQEISSLKLQIIELEAKLIEKTPINSSDKNIENLQIEIKTIRKQNIEQRQLLLTEQLRIQKESEKYQSEVQNLTKEMYDRELSLLRKDAENKVLQEDIKNMKTKITELEKLCDKYKEDYDSLKNKLVDVVPKNNEKPRESEHILATEFEEYLNEIVYLYKTLISNCKERTEEKTMKINNIKALENIMKDMSDKKITKEKLKTIVINSLPLFPFLSKFDIKADYKFIVIALIKVIEHKITKLEKYSLECDRNKMVLEYSEQKLNAYNQKLISIKNHAKP